jgi:hypothetical protein
MHASDSSITRPMPAECFPAPQSWSLTFLIIFFPRAQFVSYDKYTGEVPCLHACTGNTRAVLRNDPAERAWGCLLLLAMIQVCLVAGTLDQHSSRAASPGTLLLRCMGGKPAAQLRGWAPGQLQKPRTSPSASPAWPAAAACACSGYCGRPE